CVEHCGRHVAHRAASQQARVTASRAQCKSTARPGGAGGGFITDTPAAAARLAVLDHHGAPALGTLPHLLAVLLELEDDFHLTARLAARAHGAGQERGEEHDGRSETHAPTPGSGLPRAGGPTRASTREDAGPRLPPSPSPRRRRPGAPRRCRAA